MHCQKSLEFIVYIVRALSCSLLLKSLIRIFRGMRIFEILNMNPVCVIFDSYSKNVYSRITEDSEISEYLAAIEYCAYFHNVAKAQYLSKLFKD